MTLAAGSRRRRMPMSRGRPPRPPTGRNLALYHEVVGEGRSQRDVASRFSVSQARVARVCRKLRGWVADWLAGLPQQAVELATLPGCLRALGRTPNVGVQYPVQR